MYNGIGLLTPRGTGTSGHIQNNKFNIRHGPPNRLRAPDEQRAGEGNKHNAKRELELKVAEEQAKLEDEGCVPRGAGAATA